MANDYVAWLLAIASFAFVMTFTPGPNNIMLATSGANFGMKRSMPHVMGVAFGFPAMLVVVAVGIGYVFQFPVVRGVLRVVGLAYIIYLAYLIASANTLSSARQSKPITFWQAAGFQWINPKAWAQAIGATSAYLSLDFNKYAQIIAMALVFLPIGIASSWIWAAFGVRIAALLNTPTKLRTFNVIMAAALLVTILPVILTY
ncbi:threonine/homoserine/homoserine lactone efflux protein [Modicisalibacter xianhensis]|uniref:Threonine/homoserine/homoserine lactone efflux protein n=1 Tax=Modicisalibacter xianhensis TaxID=442341 RepID=A0A4R8FDC6_9GAMM|nr:LysE family transporter [Halomonas xianhensis]TDX23709.1 threonine/homoserine/homoserine lactone efflux protein [Halomonas xianhensis]